MRHHCYWIYLHFAPSVPVHTNYHHPYVLHGLSTYHVTSPRPYYLELDDWGSCLRMCNIVFMGVIEDTKALYQQEWKHDVFTFNGSYTLYKLAHSPGTKGSKNLAWKAVSPEVFLAPNQKRTTLMQSTAGWQGKCLRCSSQCGWYFRVESTCLYSWQCLNTSVYLLEALNYLVEWTNNTGNIHKLTNHV